MRLNEEKPPVKDLSYSCLASAAVLLGLLLLVLLLLLLLVLLLLAPLPFCGWDPTDI
jgi:hypothetical protein